MLRVLSGAKEVVAERNREGIDPLEIVDDQHQRVTGAQSAMHGLEYPQWIEWGRAVRALEQQLVQPRALLPERCQLAKQRRHGSKRYRLLGVVTRRPDDASGAEAVTRLVKQPALTATGLAGDDRNRNAIACADIGQARKHVQFSRAPHERGCHRLSVLLDLDLRELLGNTREFPDAAPRRHP